MSCVNVTCNMSPVTCHLTTTLCSFSSYESPGMSDDAAEGGMLNERVKNEI